MRLALPVVFRGRGMGRHCRQGTVSWKGIPSSPDGTDGLIYNPSNLLGLEAPMSIMAAARFLNRSVDQYFRNVVDLTALAATDLEAGRLLDIVGTRHVIPDLEPSLTPAVEVGEDTPLPYYIAVGGEARSAHQCRRVNNSRPPRNTPTCQF